jgi:hypothetical protein
MKTLKISKDVIDALKSLDLNSALELKLRDHLVVRVTTGVTFFQEHTYAGYEAAICQWVYVTWQLHRLNSPDRHFICNGLTRMIREADRRWSLLPPPQPRRAAPKNKPNILFAARNLRV